jgi:hypothetical protein
MGSEVGNGIGPGQLHPGTVIVIGQGNRGLGPVKAEHFLYCKYNLKANNLNKVVNSELRYSELQMGLF